MIQRAPDQKLFAQVVDEDAIEALPVCRAAGQPFEADVHFLNARNFRGRSGERERLADAQIELERIKSERRLLDEQIAAAEGASALGSVDPHAAADAIVAQLQQMTANIEQMPVFALRQLLTSVIEKIFIDMETRAVEIQLMLPLEMALGGKTAETTMRLVGTPASSTSVETHPKIHIKLGRFDCIEQRIGKPSDGSIKRPCYVCHRRAA